jgi:Stealth protein CR2, conserved region 2
MVRTSRKGTLAKRWVDARDQGSRFPYEVDFVVLWVEDDRAHQNARAATSERQESARSLQRFGFDNQTARFRDNDELRACLRSVFWCLPWIRRVHVVVADYQYPDRYVREDPLPEGYHGPEICVVDHSSILPAADLPTFNSQAIEAHLHRIPGLAERFIYSNDDFMAGTQLQPSYFFDSSTGAPRYNLDDSFVPDRRKKPSMSKHSMAWVNNSRVLDMMFGPTSSSRRNYPSHVMVPMLRTSFVEVWNDSMMRVLLRRTSSSPFRTSSNIYLIGFLVYWNIYLHAAQRRSHHGCLFHDVQEGDDIRGLMRHVLSTAPPLLCLNDGAYDRNTARTLRVSMRAFFPLPAAWEPSAPVHPMMLSPRPSEQTMVEHDRRVEWVGDEDNNEDDRLD